MMNNNSDDDDLLSALTITYRESLNDIIFQKGIHFIVQNLSPKYTFNSEYDLWTVLDAHFDNYQETNIDDELFLTLITFKEDKHDIMFMLGFSSCYPRLTMMLNVKQMQDYLATVNYKLPINAKLMSGHAGLVRFADLKLGLKDQ
ncbi:hypothetical protein [Photobacterium iliopiscarium]|uniref:hypothetical protein n=1 Tax=Photobacterium iliopiscarium TaxID=56192 RepID=UPI001E2B85FA|nr:hypothetical protein [Photobacterium iliopiscarium]MCD9485903.1 hypothetical protein [Photobacterium iliopiscarium]MCF2242600.1 hypothetical protein [Photobacterium iliopiscarium]